MFRLFQEIPGELESTVNVYQQHIACQVKALVQQIEEAEAADNQKSNDEIQICIGKIIELHDQYTGYVLCCFEDHELFRKALREAFDVFCNEDIIAGASSAEMLARFCAQLIEKADSSEKFSDEAVEETLEKAIKLPKYLNDKDLFVEFYRKKLAQWLLSDKIGGCNDNERILVSMLKRHSGAYFTSKLEGMLTDVMMASETKNKLQDWFSNKLNEKPKFDLSVTILRTGFWPSYKSYDLKLPSEMAKGLEAFKNFYQTLDCHRKLKWIYSLVNCHINCKFEQKNIELFVSTYQASTLLLFNDADSLSFSEIKALLNISEDDLVTVLHSLSCTKHKILNKMPKTKTISEMDSFEINTKFTDRTRTRIRIPLAPVDDKRYNIDAALVRIMKSRKVVCHQQLVAECVEMLSKTFEPDIKTINKQIEDLISRDFLDRDGSNPSVFIYLP